jgi:hypothetical protein
MSVAIKDDGKGKWQSVVATLEIPHTNATMGHFSGEMVGYGATADEARQNLLEAAKGLSLAVANAAVEHISPSSIAAGRASHAATIAS